ncbi:MAG: polysaccharide deacetylase family protein [Selenomonadaceae bacterium]|nr:polysaccharide deacetylase family protein [Selenomonadaceae bacterium]
MALVFVGLALAVCYLFQRSAGGVPVLNYHQINDTEQNALTVNTEQFNAQMQYLADNGYHTITPSEMLDAWDSGAELPDKPVIITFDDGYADNYRHAFPILERYKLKATVFLISDYISTYPNYLTWFDTHVMQESGLITFGSHTLSHEVLSDGDTSSEIIHQLRGSKEALEWHLGQSVNFIAYPCGTYTEEVKSLTKEAGYRAAFTVNYGLAEPDEERFILDRIPIFGSNSHTLFRFKLRLIGAPVIAPLMRLKQNLNDGGHTLLARLIVIP